MLILKSILVALALVLVACGEQQAETQQQSTQSKKQPEPVPSDAKLPEEQQPPAAIELTEALKVKLAAEHLVLEERLEQTSDRLQYRKLEESLAMQRAQILTVAKIQGCQEPLEKLHRCRVFLDIKMEGLPGSQTRVVDLLSSRESGAWVIKEMSLPN